MNKLIFMEIGYAIVSCLLLFLFFQGNISIKWHHYFSWGTFTIIYGLTVFFYNLFIMLLVIFFINCFFEIIVITNL